MDLTSGGQVAGLRASLTALKQDRDRLLAELEDVPGLYDELAARDEKIARLESRGIEGLQDINGVYRAALEKIVAQGGRGGLRIATAALDH